MKTKTKRELEKELETLKLEFEDHLRECTKNALMNNGEELINRQQLEMGKLQKSNSDLNNYVNQLRSKLQEIALMLSQYEKTVLLMAGRLQEKDTIISEQQNEINKRSE